MDYTVDEETFIEHDHYHSEGSYTVEESIGSENSYEDYDYIEKESVNVTNPI
jgi:hypothetical protein